MTDVRVVIEHKGQEPEYGVVPVRALPYYESKGYKAVDAEQVKAARKADGITESDAEAASEQLTEALDGDSGGTAAGSAEDKSKTRGRASGSSS